MSAKRRFALENREASRAQWRQQAEQRLAKAVEEFFFISFRKNVEFPSVFRHFSCLFHVPSNVFHVFPWVFNGFHLSLHESS